MKTIKPIDSTGPRTLIALHEWLIARPRPVVLLEGTRQVTAEEMAELTEFGTWLARHLPEAIFRSGNAIGSDAAFIDGVAAVAPDRVELVLPTPRMGRGRVPAPARVISLTELDRPSMQELGRITVSATPEIRNLVEYHLGDNPSSRGSMIAAYLLRDTLKVTGDNRLGVNPASLGIFCVNPEQPMRGGTGHTIRVCHQRRVPVVFQDTWRDWMTGPAAADNLADH